MDGLTLTVNGGDGILNVFLPVGYRLTPQTNEILFFIFIVVGIHLIGPNGCRFIQLLSPVTSNNNIQRIQFRVVRCCDSRQSLPSSICPTCENEEPQKKPRPSFKYQFEFDFFSVLVSDNLLISPWPSHNKTAINADLQLTIL